MLKPLFIASEARRFWPTNWPILLNANCSFAPQKDEFSEPICRYSEQGPGVSVEASSFHRTRNGESPTTRNMLRRCRETIDCWQLTDLRRRRLETSDVYACNIPSDTEGALFCRHRLTVTASYCTRCGMSSQYSVRRLYLFTVTIICSPSNKK